jgi:hypothetical protein
MDIYRERERDRRGVKKIHGITSRMSSSYACNRHRIQNFHD